MVGLGKARGILMLGDRYTAAEPHALGLAYPVMPEAELEPEALTLARRLAAQPQAPLRRMKPALTLTATTDLERALAV